VPMAKKVLNGVLYPEQLVLGMVYGDAHSNRIRMTKERLVDIAFGRTPDLKMLDGWGRKRDLPDKTNGGPTATELSREWEERGPTTDDGTPAQPPTPSWLLAAQGGAPQQYASVNRTDAEEEEARQQWLAWHMGQREWEKASELVVSDAERDELARLRRLDGDA
jgi:hypothetical protein